MRYSTTTDPSGRISLRDTKWTSNTSLGSLCPVELVGINDGLGLLPGIANEIFNRLDCEEPVKVMLVLKDP